jgi:Fe-S-cluster containining protein
VRDGPLRRALKRVALLNFQINIALQRAWQRRSGGLPYRLGGDCRRCARCCEAPGIQVGRLVWYLPALRAAFLWWQRAVNGFELTGRDPAQRVFVFRCSHFDWATRTCDSYTSRPGICRDYPRALLAQPNPELLPGCGYRPVAMNADRLAAALARQALTPEQREKLRKELFLDA